MAEALKIDVWSDVACPWCYIGKRRLESALQEFAQTPDAPPVQIEYHSFELTPEMPVDFDGSMADFLMPHMGMSAEQVEQMIEQTEAIATSVGLDYAMYAVQMTNTIKAHQLLHYAKAHGKQLETKERLLAAYFVEGRHVGRVADLADLAAEVGLDRDDVVRSLEADEYAEAVQSDKDLATRYGIRGVPFYVVDGRYGISGAQEPTVFVETFVTAAAARGEAASAG